MDTIQIYDHSTIDSFTWPNTEEGRIAKNYLKPLIKEKVETFIRNVSTQMFLITCNGFFLPISVNETEYENSYIASNYYCLSFYYEFMNQKHPIFLKFQKPFMKLGEKLLQKMEINKCIFLNNWLMTNNIPSLGFDTNLQEIVQFLQKKFPEHVMIYRNIDSYQKKQLLKVLQKNRFRLLKTRDVFLYDPAKKDQLSTKAQSHHRKDRKLLEKYGFTIVRQFEESDIDEMLNLYEKVYVQKHTTYSPKYTKKYIQNALENKIFDFMGLKRNGRLEAIMGLYVKDQTMVTSFFGYDTELPYSGELYRLLSILILEEAEKRNVVLNDSSGGEKTKKYRGLTSHAEFLGVYHHHLSFGKKLFWAVLSRIYRFFMNSNCEF